MAVLDALVTDLQRDRLRIRRVERRGRQCYARAGLVRLVFPIDIVFGRHPQARVLVRDDLRARAAEHVVAACGGRVPVRVQQRAERHARKLRANQSHERGCVFRRAAVDERGGIRRLKKNNVTTGAADQRQSVAHRCGRERCGGLCRS